MVVALIGQCVAVKAQNCLTALTENECLTCPEQFGLKKEDELTNCVPVEDPNCITYEIAYPFKCLVCREHYYHNNETQVCDQVVKQIPGCSVYETKEKCGRCEDNLLLNDQGKECIEASKVAIEIDPNCIDIVLSANSECVACQPGYYFDTEGNCVACGENNLESGCYACDPYNHGKCAMCRSGYYQSRTGKCVENPNDIVTFNLSEDDGSSAYLLFTSFVLITAVTLV